MTDIRTVAARRGIAWFSEGFTCFQNNSGAWIGIGLILLIMGVVSLFFPFSSLIIQLVTPVLIGGLLLGCRESNNGGQLRLNHLFAGFSHYTGNLVLLGVLYTVTSIVIMGLMFGMAVLAVGGNVILSVLMDGNPVTILDNLLILMLVILAGLLMYVPLLMAFWFSPALIVFEGHHPLSAMKYSFLGCVKNCLAFLVYGLAGMLLAIIASIPFMLGWIVLMPVTIIGFYLSYRDIFAQVINKTSGQGLSHVS